MREIKFRAWGKSGTNKGRMIPFEEFKHWVDWVNDADVELMQYTGLKDKNGKEIYEGDIIDFAGLKPLKIVWREAGFCAPLVPYEDSDPIALTQDGCSAFAEVIGNIYENQELLK